jgi:hypothetical protein
MAEREIRSATGAARRGGSQLAALVSLVLVLAAAQPVLGASAGPQPSTTGVPAVGAEPAEGLCISCHTSFPLNPDAAGTLTLEGVPPRYEAGRVYKLTLRVSHNDPALLRWGFQMTAVAMKDGAGAGEFLATDAATTQVISAMSGTRSYVEHSYGGTAIGQTGGAAWSFDWKAPAGGLGRIGFFAAANAANADGSNQGDRVYSRSPQPLAETDSGGS